MDSNSNSHFFSQLQATKVNACYTLQMTPETVQRFVKLSQSLKFDGTIIRNGLVYAIFKDNQRKVKTLIVGIETAKNK